MFHQDNIKAVTFKNNPNSVEHQWFPVEYFSGSDVTIYFGDVFLSECTALEFNIEERVNPIFSYGSYNFDCVARGSRLITGSFVIPFTEAGYLDAILMHIGQYTSDEDKVKPKMAYKLSGQKVPGWCADYKMDVEGLFDKFDPGNPINQRSATRTVTVTPGSSSAAVSALSARMMNSVGYIETPLSQYMRSVYGDISPYYCEQIVKEKKDDEEFIKAIQGTINFIFEKDNRQRFRKKDGNYSRDGESIVRKLSELNVDGMFDSVSSDSLRLVLNWFRINHKPRTVQSPSYDVGSVIEIDDIVVKFLMGFTSDDKYDPQTFLQVTSFQQQTRSPGEGDFEVEEEVKPDDSGIIGAHDTTITPTFGTEGNLTRWEDRTRIYEQEIWGRDFTQDYERRFQTYFYTDRYRNAGLNGEEMLKKYGFDVYITYGPQAEAQKYAAWQTENPTQADAIGTYTFKTTVKAIRNVQITSCRQLIGADGSPISEMYTFVAKDLD